MCLRSSNIPEQLPKAGRGTLHFDQYAQKYDIPCCVDLLAEDNPVWQATFWHNSLFNPNIPDGAQILALAPDRVEARADPPAA